MKMKIVPTLCVGMQPVTLRVTSRIRDAERPRRHSHAERGNDCQGGGQNSIRTSPLKIVPTLRVGTQPVTLRVTSRIRDAERPRRHSHAERGNDHQGG
ncbi:hypothetical protein FIV37_09455 [Pseudomonas gessardii]|nr:hypothetical protein [Pseudomonas gessardii]